MIGSWVDPKTGDQLLNLLTAPSRGRASTAEPYQGWGPKAQQSGRSDQVRVTLLKQKGSLGKRIGRAAQKNHRATKEPTIIRAALLFYRWGDEGLSHSAA